MTEERWRHALCGVNRNQYPHGRGIRSGDTGDEGHRSDGRGRKDEPSAGEHALDASPFGCIPWTGNSGGVAARSLNEWRQRHQG